MFILYQCKVQCISITCFTIVFQVRLVNGKAPSRGRVEVLYSGDWRPVCSYGWNLQHANVVCHQLGYNGAKASVDSQLVTKQRRWKPMWLDGVQCDGNETLIMDCRHKGLDYCWHGSSASLVCIPEGTICKFNFICYVIDLTWLVPASKKSKNLANIKMN